MSDIHGCYSEMKEALECWDKEEEQLVIIGDLIDRGSQSLQVVQYLKGLKEKYPEQVVILKGNHDEMFEKWLMGTPFEMLAYYYNREHEETIESFYEDKERYRRASRRQKAEHIIYNNKEELSFLNELPYYYETEHILFVHAGVDLDSGEDWKDNTKEMVWSRTFPYKKKEFGKRVFFGHTPTPYLHEEEGNYNIWVNEKEDKVCIDGGVVFGGQLNALKIDNKGNILEEIKIKARS